MKKIIFTLVGCIAALSTFAQLTVADTVYKTIAINDHGAANDTLTNKTSNDITVNWNIDIAGSTVAAGHSGVSMCFLPGQCYAYDNSPHSDLVAKSSSAIMQLDWKIEPTATKGSQSIIKVNTDINGGKKLTFIVTAGNPLSTEQLDAQAYNIYPQPATDILNIDVPNAKTSKVEIVNISGAIVNATPTNGNAKTEINIGNLNTGLYFVHIYNNENKIIARKKISKN